jgi:hypothetical protein
MSAVLVVIPVVAQHEDVARGPIPGQNNEKSPARIGFARRDGTGMPSSTGSLMRLAIISVGAL